MEISLCHLHSGSACSLKRQSLDPEIRCSNLNQSSLVKQYEPQKKLSSHALTFPFPVFPGDSQLWTRWLWAHHSLGLCDGGSQNIWEDLGKPELSQAAPGQPLIMWLRSRLSVSCVADIILSARDELEIHLIPAPLPTLTHFLPIAWRGYGT